MRQRGETSSSLRSFWCQWLEGVVERRADPRTAERWAARDGSVSSSGNPYSLREKEGGRSGTDL